MLSRGQVPFALAFLLLVCVGSISAIYTHHVVKHSNGGYKVLPGPGSGQNVVAQGGFDGKLFQTGWDRLWVGTNRLFPDDIQSFAAGFMEGNLTATQIDYWHTNFVFGVFGDKPPTQTLLKYMKTQIDWSRAVSSAVYRLTHERPNFDGSISVNVPRYSTINVDAQVAAFWRQVHYIYQQLEGLLAGYLTAMPEKPLTFMDIYLMNAAGDLEDLVGYFSRGMPENELPPIVHTTRRKIQAGLDCSAFIKPVSPAAGAGFTDYVFGHTTWSEFNSMNRIYKQYNISLNDAFVKSSYVAFSSRPAFLSSKDDFYITDAGLGTQETTLGLYNKTLYDNYLIPDQSVLCFMRSMIANRLADSGDLWTQYFGLYNSGTYNNQWMVIDTKKFKPGSKSLTPGSLWIIEQIPGFTKRQDVTPVVNAQGYWPSFNIPYFEYIYGLAGWNGSCSGDGACPGFLSAPRWALFARLQSQVTSLESLKKLMQHNDYLNDPESKGDPSLSISSRYDLRTTKPAIPFGGLDSKLSSWSLLKNGAKNPVTSWAISGPTHQSLPPFSWDRFPNVTHVGMPQLWNFDWQAMVNPWQQNKKMH